MKTKTQKDEFSQGHIVSKRGAQLKARLSDSRHQESSSWVHLGAAAGTPHVAQEGIILLAMILST